MSIRRKLIQETATTESTEIPTITRNRGQLHDRRKKSEVVPSRIFGARPKRGIAQAPGGAVRFDVNGFRYGRVLNLGTVGAMDRSFDVEPAWIGTIVR
jgi:hypothetical protein